jgi:hypothetical protein
MEGDYSAAENNSKTALLQCADYGYQLQNCLELEENYMQFYGGEKSPFSTQNSPNVVNFQQNRFSRHHNVSFQATFTIIQE